MHRAHSKAEAGRSSGRRTQQKGYRGDEFRYARDCFAACSRPAVRLFFACFFRANPSTHG